MDTIEYRAVIKFFVKEGLTLNVINSKSIEVYGDSSPSFSSIKEWAAEFKRGRTGLEDDPREEGPKSATTPEIIEQVHDMVLDKFQAHGSVHRYDNLNKNANQMYFVLKTLKIFYLHYSALHVSDTIVSIIRSFSAAHAVSGPY